MRILVVEDEAKMAALLERGLREQNYAIDVARTAEDAIWLGSENSYDAIVLDVMLPDGNGFDVCERIRKAGRWSPILMLTARDAVADRVAGLDGGADDYLTKPFAFDELLARIRVLVRRGAEPRPAVLTAGPLRLDPANREVVVGGTAVDLTSREFALLECLMRHPGIVLSRTRIREHVWDFAFDGDSNVIDVYIGYLRAKIDRVFGLNLIETVRGAGYRIRGTARASADQD
ncbi:MAG: response regulator transcription factor [Alphaproteobacteria bacterium]